MASSGTWNDVARELARLTGTQAADWLPVAKARYGMYAALKAVREVHGGAGAVLTQLYTCVTAVDPILAAGFTPCYGDIDPRTLALDASSVRAAAHDAAAGPVRAVVLQHTFGVIDDEASRLLARSAREQGALVMEDCAHSLGRMACDADGSPVADVSVHSFGVEKMVHCSFGGAIWVNPRLEAGLRDRIRAELGHLPVVAGARATAIHTYPAVIRVLAHLPNGPARALRTALARVGLFEFAVSPAEQRGGMSDPALPDAWIVNRMRGSLDGYERGLDARRRMVDVYRSMLPLAPLGAPAAKALECPAAVLAGESQPLLAFPVYLADEERATAAVAALRSAGFYARAWYRPLLFPGVDDAAAYHVDPAARYPMCERCSQGAVLLPVDLDEERTRAAARVLCETAGL